MLKQHLTLQLFLAMFASFGAKASALPALGLSSIASQPSSRPTAPQVDHRPTPAPETGKATPSAIILLVFGGLFELWIVYALVFALLTRGNGQTYLVRVGKALKFQLR